MTAPDDSPLGSTQAANFRILRRVISETGVRILADEVINMKPCRDCQHPIWPRPADLSAAAMVAGAALLFALPGSASSVMSSLVLP